MKNIIVGITGASGAIYGEATLDILSKREDIKSHLVISPAASLTIRHELEIDSKILKEKADFFYPYKDIGACIASGSAKIDGMVIAPCSIKTMSSIATGNTDNLLARSADVILKERKRLVILLRETPLHSIHLENMKKLSDCGAIIMPPVPAFYTKPKTIEDIVRHTAKRSLELLDIDTDIERWSGLT